MATRELLSHSTMEEGSKGARRKRRHRGGTEDKSRMFLLLLTSALTLVNVGAEPQGAGEPCVLACLNPSFLYTSDLKTIARHKSYFMWSSHY